MKLLHLSTVPTATVYPPMLIWVLPGLPILLSCHDRVQEDYKPKSELLVKQNIRLKMTQTYYRSVVLISSIGPLEHSLRRHGRSFITIIVSIALTFSSLNDFAHAKSAF